MTSPSQLAFPSRPLAPPEPRPSHVANQSPSRAVTSPRTVRAAQPRRVNAGPALHPGLLAPASFTYSRPSPELWKPGSGGGEGDTLAAPPSPLLFSPAGSPSSREHSRKTPQLFGTASVIASRFLSLPVLGKSTSGSRRPSVRSEVTRVA